MLYAESTEIKNEQKGKHRFTALLNYYKTFMRTEVGLCVAQNNISSRDSTTDNLTRIENS